MTITADKTKALSIFTIVMITITSVDSIRNLPATALFGSPLIFFFIMAGLFFLVPSALVSSELATGWPKTGGVYVWVREAFGEKTGFFAIWFQWVENVIWYPTILAFVAGSLAYLISPALANNRFYLCGVIIGTFWALTFINMAGLKSSARFSAVCGIGGLIIPMILIIGLGITWVATGHDLQIDFKLHHLLPDAHDTSMMVSLTGVVLCFCGIEIATAHASDVKNPQRDYPRALLISVLFIFFTMLLASLSIAIIVPGNQLSLVSGVMQAFSKFFVADHISWMTPILALAIVIGSLGGVSNWIIAPNRGLLVALNDAEVGGYLRTETSTGAPIGLLLYQGVLVTLLACLFLFMPTINSSYWILTAMTAQLYMGMYILMFAAAIYLRYKRPDTPRAFRIPGGKLGIWLVSCSGIIVSIITIVIGFFPPKNIDLPSLLHYEITMVTWLLIMCCPPLIFFGVKQFRRN
ncbi:MAG: amino acid permease [Legionellales bacterium]|nr:amino acid permease [Legionellales bacterium]|tara:strand:+ start:25450 stop:26847 length:1398 start_codon:yes stop_codon:yes gene_type:complete